MSPSRTGRPLVRGATVALLGLLALLATVGPTLLGLVGATPAEAQATSTSTPSSGADCSQHLDVLLLMDESASLKTTDPQNQRVQAAEVLVRSLAASAAASGGSVGLTIAGFGTSAAEVGRATLPTGTDQAVATVESFATRTDDRNTDYVLALRYAADHFARVTDLPTECKRLVWFTDGAYSIDDLTAPGIATYTASTQKAAIESELGGQVCGPLPASSQLTAPLSEQIRAAGFYVQLVDFRVTGRETAADRQARDATAPVIDRLLTTDGPCRVPGGRVEAGQANALATQFFSQGQIALGRREVPCADLAAGYPAALVRAVTARADDPARTVEIVRDGNVLASGAGFATYVTPADAATTGKVAARATGGSLAGCYADLAAEIVPLGDGTVFGNATTSFLRFAVVGRGPSSHVDDLTDRLGPDAVTVTAAGAGSPLAATWQDTSKSWQIAIAGPVASVPPIEVVASTAGWGELTRLTQTVTVKSAPPLPRVAWSGPSTLEGAGTFAGRLTVVPGAVTGGALCVTFAPAETTDPQVQVRLPAGPVCGSDAQSFSTEVEVDVSGSRNADVTVTVPFTASYRPAGGGVEQPLEGSGAAAFPTFALTKAADATTSLTVTVVLVALSAIVPLLILLVFVNLQRRLPATKGRRVLVVPLASAGGALSRDPAAAVSDLDLQALHGDPRHYDLPGGLAVRARRTWNPFAEMTVEVTSDAGPVTAVPWMAAGVGRAVEVPVGFRSLVLLRAEPGSDHGEAVVVTAPGDDARSAVATLDDALATTNSLWHRVNSAMAAAGL